MDTLHADEFLRLAKEQTMLLRRLAGANVHTDRFERDRVQARIKEIEMRQNELSRQRAGAAFDVVV